MTTIADIATEYKVTKPTVRRWIKAVNPEWLDPKHTDLTNDQLHILAEYVAEYFPKHVPIKDSTSNRDNSKCTSKYSDETETFTGEEYSDVLEHLKAENKEIKDKLTASQIECAKLEERCEGLREVQKVLRTNILELKANISELEDRIENLQDEKARISADLRVERSIGFWARIKRSLLPGSVDKGGDEFET